VCSLRPRNAAWLQSDAAIRLPSWVSCTSSPGMILHGVAERMGVEALASDTKFATC
jgi:hypothetical protein